MNIVVVRVERIVDTLFIVVVMLLMMAAYVGMGCAVELSVVKEVLKKPVPPFIGFCSQYFIMPLTAFGLVRIFNLSGGIGLGFFASGCAPGGGASNMYTYMLGGDTSLSVTMTVVSTLTALAMFPAWLYALRYFIPGVEGTTFKIPYYNILASLATMVIPLTIGILIRLKRPQLACSIKKALRPFFAFIIIFLFTVGIWSNIYLVYLFSAKLFLAACILSYSGFLLGGFFAFICRLPLARIIAVAIETGVQNTGLPILLLKFSLMQPEADMSVVSPVSVAMFMPVPLWIAIAVLEVRKCVNKKKQTDPKEPLDLLVGDQRLTNDGGEELNDELDELAINRDPINNRSTKLEYSENGNVPKIVIDSDNDLKPSEKHEGDI
ncbi:hypothetical protein HELRODRAFT_103288 [Helobdella robusta]|uniref:P3 protein n=1 Tax=Helobdella robusta TaxID=6412 RepID=T1EDF4_HELRO|nr:hypothetical protein HELRODRAFT_103288 [Helobdella robusta]ESN93769.1 hypothetical protein HELRODRAFT_103288 [Helobdella robusta]